MPNRKSAQSGVSALGDLKEQIANGKDAGRLRELRAAISKDHRTQRYEAELVHKPVRDRKGSVLKTEEKWPTLRQRNSANQCDQYTGQNSSGPIAHKASKEPNGKLGVSSSKHIAHC